MLFIYHSLITCFRLFFFSFLTFSTFLYQSPFLFYFHAFSFPHFGFSSPFAASSSSLFVRFHFLFSCLFFLFFCCLFILSSSLIFPFSPSAIHRFPGLYFPASITLFIPLLSSLSSFSIYGNFYSPTVSFLYFHLFLSKLTAISHSISHLPLLTLLYPLFPPLLN